MKTLTIKGTLREKKGTKSAQDARRAETVPCVIYGGKENIHFTATEKEFKPLIYTPDIHMVKIDVGGRTIDAVMKEIQFHKITDKVIHIDFVEVIPGKKVIVQIPVKTEGSAIGVRAGGKLLQKFRTLNAKAVVDKLPANITLNVEKMEIGTSLRVSDIKVDGVEFLDSPNATVVAVRITRNVEETPAAGATAAATPAASATTAAAPAAAGAKDAAKPAGKEAAKPAAKK